MINDLFTYSAHSIQQRQVGQISGEKIINRENTHRHEIYTEIFLAAIAPIPGKSTKPSCRPTCLRYMISLYQQFQLTDADVNRIIEMAWEDRTPFEAIQIQFGLVEAEVIALMRREMTRRNWQKWRARVQGRKTKHLQLREARVGRFRCSRQRDVSQNRISKR